MSSIFLEFNIYFCFLSQMLGISFSFTFIFYHTYPEVYISFSCVMVFKTFKIYLEKQQQRKTEKSSIWRFTTQSLELGRAHAGLWEHNPNLRHGFQQPRDLNHHLPHPKAHISRKLKSEYSWDFDPVLQDGMWAA